MFTSITSSHSQLCAQKSQKALPHRWHLLLGAAQFTGMAQPMNSRYTKSIVHSNSEVQIATITSTMPGHLRHISTVDWSIASMSVHVHQLKAISFAGSRYLSFLLCHHGHCLYNNYNPSHLLCCRSTCRCNLSQRQLLVNKSHAHAFPAGSGAPPHPGLPRCLPEPLRAL